MMLVFLWSDIFLYMLTVVMLLGTIFIVKNSQLSKRWKKVFQSKVGMASFIIIMTYFCICLLDSIHFRESISSIELKNDQGNVYYSNQVHSVLDKILGGMGELKEKTYSAPFSLKSYSKENMKDDKGKVYREYPSLKYSGAHLSYKDNKVKDVFLQSIIAILLGFLFAMILVLLHFFFLRKKYSSLPWLTGYSTVVVMSCLISWLLYVGNLYHVLGTDMAGNDVLYKSIKGIRTGMLIGGLATIVMLPIAIFFGVSAGYFKGWVDDIIQYLYTTLSSIPGILLIASSVLLFQVWIDLHGEYFNTGLEKGDVRLVGLCFILGITSWSTLCRILRAEALKISQLGYIQAAQAFGVSHFRILIRHFLPNVMHIVLITFILDFSGLVLAEAVLAYVGIGVDSSIMSWGNMIAAGSSELSREPIVWWNLVGAFLFMFVLLIAANFLSDLINDVFNPRSENFITFSD